MGISVLGAKMSNDTSRGCTLLCGETALSLGRVTEEGQFEQGSVVLGGEEKAARRNLLACHGTRSAA